MKQFFTLFISLASFWSLAQAPSPIIDRSYSNRFQSEVQCSALLPNGGLVLGVRDNNFPGELFSDSIFAYILDSTGGVTLRKPLSKTNSEIHFFHQVLHIPSGGFLFSFEGTLCDVGSDMTILLKTDENLNQVWRIDDDWQQQNFQPDDWQISSDGNLIGVGYNKLWKLNALTGALIWEKEINLSAGQSINHIQLIEGTEDFFAFGQPQFQKWVFNGINYALLASANPSGYFSRHQMGSNGHLYAYEWSSKRIYDYNPLLQGTEIPHSIDEMVNFVSSPNGLYVCERSGSNTKVYLLGFDGAIIQTLEPFSNWQIGSISLNGSRLYMIGTDHSGLSNSDYYKDPMNVWLRIYPTPESGLPIKTDADITAIEQLSGIDTSGIYAPFFNATLYNLNGGSFRVQIKNAGTSVLQKVRVNTRFEPNQFWGICFNIPAQYRDYDDLNLAPGAAVWKDFGDVSAQGQFMLRPICFWTSGPNDVPDAVHENDGHCIDAQYSVTTSEPYLTPALQLSPNPTTDFLTVTHSSALTILPWQIVNALGEVLKSGSFEGDKITQVIDLKGIEPGVYYLQCGQWTGRFLVI